MNKQTCPKCGSNKSIYLGRDFITNWLFYDEWKCKKCSNIYKIKTYIAFKLLKMNKFGEVTDY